MQQTEYRPTPWETRALLEDIKHIHLNGDDQLGCSLHHIIGIDESVKDRVQNYIDTERKFGMRDRI